MKQSYLNLFTLHCLWNCEIIVSFYKVQTIRLLIYYTVVNGAAKIQVNLQNPAKFTETHKILRNLLEMLSNTCQFFTGNNYQGGAFFYFV